MSICFVHCAFVLLPIVIIDYALDVLSREFASAAGRPKDIIPPPMPPADVDSEDERFSNRDLTIAPVAARLRVLAAVRDFLTYVAVLCLSWPRRSIYYGASVPSSMRISWIATASPLGEPGALIRTNETTICSSLVAPC
jgi:hypothetical protein